MKGKMRVIKIKYVPSPRRAAKENNNRRYDQSKESSEEVKKCHLRVERVDLDASNRARTSA